MPETRKSKLETGNSKLVFETRKAKLENQSTRPASGEWSTFARVSNFGFRVSFLAAVLCAATILTGCRIDMHIQPRYNPYDPSTLFKDGRSERPVVPGTVPFGKANLRTDELLYTGRINGVTANEFPFQITKQDLERGRDRFNIYCTPCHDYAGSGYGMVVRRGFTNPRPPSYHIPRLVNAPVGLFFQTITNGHGSMYSYASRVSVEDRWRIAAYIRALQLSQHATINDVPEQQRQQLTASGQ